MSCGSWARAALLIALSASPALAQQSVGPTIGTLKTWCIEKGNANYNKPWCNVYVSGLIDAALTFSEIRTNKPLCKPTYLTVDDLVNSVLLQTNLSAPPQTPAAPLLLVGITEHLLCRHQQK